MQHTCVRYTQINAGSLIKARHVTLIQGITIAWFVEQALLQKVEGKIRNFKLN